MRKGPTKEKYSFRCICYIKSVFLMGCGRKSTQLLKRNKKTSRLTRGSASTTTKNKIDTFSYTFLKGKKNDTDDFLLLLCEFKCLICMREYHLNLKIQTAKFLLLHQCHYYIFNVYVYT